MSQPLADPVAQSLLVAISDLEIVDAHEHLWPEEHHLQYPQDVLTLLQYSLADLQVAGATPAEIDLLIAYHHGPKAPLADRWAIFRKYLPAIRHTAPIRALFIAICDLYGVTDLDDQTYEPLSALIQQARRPGLYQSILRDRCRIRYALNQNPECVRSDGFLLPIRNLHDLGGFHSRVALEALGEHAGVNVRSLDDALGAVRLLFDRWQADGTVAVKRAGTALTDPTRAEAEVSLRAALESADPTPSALPLQHFMEHEAIAEAGRRGLPVCVHAGLWAGTWGDPRQAHPEHLIPIALRHQGTRFDVYHAGIPWSAPSASWAANCPTRGSTSAGATSSPR